MKNSTPGGSVQNKPPQQPATSRGCLNHMTEEEAKDAPYVVIGKFLVLGTPALVLFDSRATGSFVSSKFVALQALPTSPLSRPLVISSPLGDL